MTLFSNRNRQKKNNREQNKFRSDCWQTPIAEMLYGISRWMSFRGKCQGTITVVMRLIWPFATLVQVVENVDVGKLEMFIYGLGFPSDRPS